MALWIEKIRDIKKVLYEIERKTNRKLYVHCLTWPSGLRKMGAENVPFFEFKLEVEMKFWSQAETQQESLK
jgi:hypothetical protein